MTVSAPALKELEGLKVLVVCQGIPHASRGASSVLFFHYISSLCEAGARVASVLLIEGEEDKPAIQNFETEVKKKLPSFEVTTATVDRFVTSDRIRVTLHVDLASKIKDRIDLFQPDVLLCFDIVAAGATRGFNGKRLVWLGDLNFQSFFYHGLYSALERPKNFLKFPIVLWRCFLWKKFYREALSSAKVVVSSGSSVHHLLKLGVASEYQGYPWPARPIVDANVPQNAPPAFVFFGNLLGLGSRSAFHFLIEKLYPEAIKKFGSGAFQILICGMGSLPDWVMERVQNKKEIVFLGFVEDIDDLMRRSYAALVPIDVPVGNRSRILTALAQKTLVITHKNASQGNPSLKSGVNCFLAKDEKEFVRFMEIAVGDRDLVKEIKEQGFQLYQNEFSPSKATMNLIQSISMLRK